MQEMKLEVSWQTVVDVEPTSLSTRSLTHFYDKTAGKFSLQNVLLTVCKPVTNRSNPRMRVWASIYLEDQGLTYYGFTEIEGVRDMDGDARTNMYVKLREHLLLDLFSMVMREQV